jgi:FOG: WD40-like repeat
VTRGSRRDVLRAVGAAATATLTGVAGCSAAVSYRPPDDVESGPAGPADPTGETTTFRGGLARLGYYPAHSTPEEPELAWSHPLNTGDHSAAKASAVPLRPGEGSVVVPGDDGSVYAFEANGEQVWRADTEAPSRGIHGTPTVAGDTVYVGAYDGALYAFDRETGERRWRVRLGDAIGSSPAYRDGRVYIAVEYNDPDGSLFAVDARSGEPERDWTRPTDHPHSTCALAPDADRIVVGSNDGGLYAWRLSDGEPAWAVQTGEDIKGPVAVYDGAAFVGSWNHDLYRVDLADGTVDWRYETGNLVMSGPAVDPRRDTLYVGSHDTHLHALDPVTGERRWRFDTGRRITGCPSVVGEHVIVGSVDTRLYALTRAGERVWTVDLDGWVTSAPRPVGEAVYVAERAPQGADGPPGRVYAIR